MSKREPSVHEILRRRLELAAGLPLPAPAALASDGLAGSRLAELQRSEWAPGFWGRVVRYASPDDDLYPDPGDLYGWWPTELRWRVEAFETLMRNRLVMGALRYGRIGAIGKPSYDRTGSMDRRYKLWLRSGNAEYLVDIANLCLLQSVEGPARVNSEWVALAARCLRDFVFRRHRKFHFTSVDDGHHVGVNK